MTAPSQRIGQIDALRALALAGILQINIQSFVWGDGDPLGYFLNAPSTADHIVDFVARAFIEFKFMPLFALLFGAGFGLLHDKLTARGLDPQPFFVRRFLFLLGFALVHGVFFYFGDITNYYAVLGFVLLYYAKADLKRLQSATLRWWAVSLAVQIGLAALLSVSYLPSEESLDTAALLHRFELYTQAGFSQQIGPRAGDFFNALWSIYVSGWWTGIVALMLSGLVAYRSGWITRLVDHPLVYRRVLLLGLGVGLPCALLGAWLKTPQPVDALVTSPSAGWREVLLSFSGALSFAYAAIFLRYSRGRFVAWLAPAGRMPLTNYLAQSVLMGALLSGWGLGWGASMTHAELAALAFGIVALQWICSALLLRHYEQGPLEFLWRKATYRASSTLTQTPR